MRMKFINIDDDGETEVSICFNKECWLDTFPLYLKFLRASGFSIPDSVKLYAPSMDMLVQTQERSTFLFNPQDTFEY